MKIKDWYKSGSPWIWLNAAAVSASLIMVFGLLILIMVRGMGFFWPSNVAEISHINKSGQMEKLIGEIWEEEIVASQLLRETGFDITKDIDFVDRFLLKTGNRDVYGADFKLIIAPNIKDIKNPEDLVVVVRHEWGNFYGYLRDIKENGTSVPLAGKELWTVFQERMERSNDIYEQIKGIEKNDIGEVNYGLEKLRLKKRRYELESDLTKEHQAEIDREKAEYDEHYNKLQKNLNKLYSEIKRDSFTAEIQTGQIIEIPFAKVVKAYKPNEMSWLGKTSMYFANIWEFIVDDPREANTEGGVFPAIFGTVMMVMIMAVLVTPLGVIAAVYLREYAKQGPLTRTIRIAVNNLAGVPSIVYGVFGLGFFVYFLGGSIDQLFFPEALPSPTFGTPGIMWSSLTLAILTLPVVIVATEEGLSRIPRSIREGSLALGATKFETLWRTVIPMSSPAIMTGLILAVARAAGEVAPLMLVGVVKLAPSLPLDGNAPFIHLDRKFMHLGFHIYDVGFQSPNVEAARPLVYATSLLLVLVIVALNLVAIQIRNRLRERYRALEG